MCSSTVALDGLKTPRGTVMAQCDTASLHSTGKQARRGSLRSLQQCCNTARELTPACVTSPQHSMGTTESQARSCGSKPGMLEAKGHGFTEQLNTENKLTQERYQTCSSNLCYQQSKTEGNHSDGLETPTLSILSPTSLQNNNKV